MLGPGDSLGEGDSHIIYDALSPTLSNDAFDLLRNEVAWQTMHHRSGEVPRLVAVQGDIGEDDSVPLYRHPADESPPLLAFTDTVERIRLEVQSLMNQPFNHVLIQLYRHGEDNISEHSDKVWEDLQSHHYTHAGICYRLWTLCEDLVLSMLAWVLSAE